MPILQRPDLVAKIRKEYELLGPDAISTISPELVAVVLVDDISERDPGGALLFAHGYVAGGAVAGQYTSAMLWNPATTGVDLILEYFVATDPNASGTYDVRLWTAGPVTAASSQNRNLGRPGTPGGRVGYRSDAVPTGAVIGTFRQSSTDTLRRDWYWQIPPGQGISVNFATVNEVIRCYFFWTEVPRRV